MPKSLSCSRPRIRSVAVTVRRPGARAAPATSHRTCDHVGRVNRSANAASRVRRSGGRGEPQGGERACRIPFVESARDGAATPCGCGQPNQVRPFPGPHRSITVAAMTASDPQLAEIVTRFETFEVQAGRGGYTLRHRGSHPPVARLRPIPDSDRFELFYWSAVRGRWRTFGDFGRLKLTLERAHEIVHAEPIFHLQNPLNSAQPVAKVERTSPPKMAKVELRACFGIRLAPR